MKTPTRTALTLALLSAFTLAAAQGTTPDRMSKNSMPMSMSGAPMLRFTTQAGMNMMMGHSGDLMIMAAPGMGRYTYAMQGHTATLTYASRNAKALFAYYDKAIRAEGWREDMQMAMGMMKDGSYAESYVMGKYKLDLKATPKGSSTVVTFKVH